MLGRLLCLVIGYLLGMIQTGYIIGKINNIDIREHGSGNAGTTNTLRTLGWQSGLITLIGDCAKCVFAILIARSIFSGNTENLFGMYAGLGAVLGHNYPFYLKFKGGKGIACTAGIIFSTNWIMSIISILTFVTILFVTKYVSLGSIIVVIVYFIQVIIMGQIGILELSGLNLVEYYIIAFILMALAILRHKQNISRLLQGTENKFSLKK